jgi:hypothetical protein
MAARRLQTGMGRAASAANRRAMAFGAPPSDRGQSLSPSAVVLPQRRGIPYDTAARMRLSDLSFGVAFGLPSRTVERSATSWDRIAVYDL